MHTIDRSEITPEHLYRSRRTFLQSVGLSVAGALALAAAACARRAAGDDAAPPAGLGTPSATLAGGGGGGTDELGDPLTPYDAITNYNNYYEFTTDKEGVARLAAAFPTTPWSIAVGGLVRNPQTYTVDDLVTKFTPEERVYRLRCVEAWSMVIPWQGFRLRDLLNEVEPLPEAKYVRFEALYAPDVMPGQNSRWYAWPYTEGLRLDEAQHDLAILATGLYGKPLPPQDGAPIRLVVPWKYGFKSIKAIVKIDLVTDQPTSLWMAAAPNEYGFYSNVNPEVSHPRWSQATERRIGDLGRRKTLPFNGYADQVASLYEGMDLRENY